MEAQTRKGSVDLLEKYQNDEAANLVLMHAADHLYAKSQWTSGDANAIDLMDGIREELQKAQ